MSSKLGTVNKGGKGRGCRKLNMFPWIFNLWLNGIHIICMIHAAELFQTCLLSSCILCIFLYLAFILRAGTLPFLLTDIKAPLTIEITNYTLRLLPKAVRIFKSKNITLCSSVRSVPLEMRQLYYALIHEMESFCKVDI